MKQTLSTNTTVSQIGQVLSIFTEYGETEDSILAFISDEVKNVDFVTFKQGELGISKVGFNEVQFFLNNKGELVTSGEDVDRFDIDEDGQLTITE